MAQVELTDTALVVWLEIECVIGSRHEVIYQHLLPIKNQALYLRIQISGQYINNWNNRSILNRFL